MLGVLASAVIAMLIAVVAYVSLLGENNKIDELIEGFFQDIRAGNYDNVLRSGAMGSREDPSDSLFLLDLSLSKYYGLLGCSNCEMVFRKSRLWVPFLSEGPVRVDVLLRKKAGGGLFRQALSLIERMGTSPGEEAGFVKGLLTVDRKDGNWVVASIDVGGSAIEKVYADLQDQLQRHHYLTRTGRGFAMQAFEIRTDETAFVEKQMVLHMLRKAQKWLGVPTDAAMPQRGLPFQSWFKGR